jgi:hypothetical protein
LKSPQRIILILEFLTYDGKKQKESVVDILSQLWHDGIPYTRNASLVQHVGKALVRPKMVTSIHFHYTKMPRGCVQTEVPAEIAQMIHARDYLVNIY